MDSPRTGRWILLPLILSLVTCLSAQDVAPEFSLPDLKGAQQELRDYRASYPGIQIIAHPECPPDVLEEADFVGSTSGMIKWVKRERPKRVVMVTECSMSDNVAVEVPETDFVRPCNLCPYMKMITLAGIRDSLRDMKHEVLIDPAVAARARVAVARMLEVKV